MILHPKSDDWSLTTLNRGLSDSSPVNSLLNMDNEVTTVQANSGVCRDHSKGAKQDIHSVPDSPMLETVSFFGSTSSSSSANFPANRVRVKESADQKLRIEDQFANIVLVRVWGTSMMILRCFSPLHRPCPQLFI